MDCQVQLPSVNSNRTNSDLHLSALASIEVDIKSVQHSPKQALNCATTSITTPTTTTPPNPPGDSVFGSNKTQLELSRSVEVNVKDLQRCGWLCWTPIRLQECANPLVFLISLCGMVLVQSIASNGYLSSINTTIEMRYGLTTAQVGYIYASYEVSSLCATIFISYYGTHANRAHILGVGCLLLTAGYILLTAPRFWNEPYQPPEAKNDQVVLCNVTSTANQMNNQSCRSSPASSSTESTAVTTIPWALINFCLAEIVMGLGASPLYVLGPTYLWDNLYDKRQKLYATYSAYMYVTAALGPALGFVLGAAFLTVWVDFPAEPPTEYLVTNRSNAAEWLGAWWLGFIVFAIMQFMTAIPLFAFPKDLPTTNSVVHKNNHAHSTAENGGPDIDLPSFRHLPAALKRLFCNPVWLLISLLTVTEQNVATGFITFISKYLQVSFNQPAVQASIITGVVVIPAAVGGILTGAFIMRHFSLRPFGGGATRLLILLALMTSLLTIPLVTFTCAEQRAPPIGLEMTQYFSLYGPPATDTELTAQNIALAASSCWRSCNCPNLYNPVCASGTTFLSACHAGCKEMTGPSNISQPQQQTSSFTDCVCVKSADRSSTSGQCSRNSCPSFYYFLVVLFLLVFLTAVGQEPAHIITLSAVPRHEISFALGMQVFLQRALAYVPAPIYFGELFDISCIFRASSTSTDTTANTLCNGGLQSDAKGACQEYDLRLLPMIWLGVVFGIKLVSLTLCVTLELLGRQRRSIEIDTRSPSEGGATTSSELPDLSSSANSLDTPYVVSIRCHSTFTG